MGRKPPPLPFPWGSGSPNQTPAEVDGDAFNQENDALVYKNLGFLTSDSVFVDTRRWLEGI